MCLIFYSFLFTPHFYPLGSILLAPFYRWINWSLGRLYYMCQADNCKRYSLTVKITLKFMLVLLYHIIWPLPFCECLAHLATCKKQLEIMSNNKINKVQSVRSIWSNIGEKERARRMVQSRQWSRLTTVIQKWSLVSVAREEFLKGAASKLVLEEAGFIEINLGYSRQEKHNEENQGRTKHIRAYQVDQFV